MTVKGRKPRVLLVGDYPPPEGGIATHVRQLHEYLQGRKIPSLVLNIGKGRHRSETVFSCSVPDMLSEVARRRKEGWIVHLHTSGNNPKSFLLALAVGLVAPIGGSVVTLHSGLMPDFIARGTRERMVVFSALSLFTHWVLVSERQKKALEKLPRSDVRAKVLPAFLPSTMKVGAPPASFLKARERFSPLMSMAHHPSPVYGTAVAVEALERLSKSFSQIGLVVFGPETETPGFQKQFVSPGVAHRIVPLGALSNPHALGVIQASDLFLRPTLADGDSISVREALALGARCVASDAALRPEGTVVFKTNNTDSLADAVRVAMKGQGVSGRAIDAGPPLISIYQRVSAAVC